MHIFWLLILEDFLAESVSDKEQIVIIKQQAPIDQHQQLPNE